MTGSSCRAGIRRRSPTQGNCRAGSPGHSDPRGRNRLAWVVEVEVGKRGTGSTSMHGIGHDRCGLSGVGIPENVLNVTS